MAGDGNSELVNDIESFLNKNVAPPRELPETATLQDVRDNLDVLYRFVRDQVVGDPSTIHLDENSKERRYDGPRAAEYRRVIFTDQGEVRAELSILPPGGLPRLLTFALYDRDTDTEQRTPKQRLSIDSTVKEKGHFNILEGDYFSSDPFFGNTITPETIRAVNRGVALVRKTFPTVSPAAGAK